MPPIKVLVSDPIDPEGIAFLQKQSGFEIVSPAQANGLGDIEAWLVRSETKVTKEKIAQAGNLKLIGRAGTGVDNIDVDEATRRGILVINVPGANAIAVAEHVFALSLALLRRIAIADCAVKEGRWRDKTMTGSELYGKTLGLLGLGRVGREVVRRALAFGMKVMAHDPFLSAPQAEELGVHPVGFDHLIQNADLLSLHVPLTEATKGIMNASAFERMKKGAILINTSRGEIVKEVALVSALEAGHLAGAALDVYEKEPPQGSPLLKLADRVILSPHLGASTREAQRRVAQQLAASVVDFFQRGLVVGGVNLPPEFEPKTLDRLAHPLALAERLGRFLGQLLPGAWNSVILATAEKFNEKDQKVLANAGLRGVLSCALGDTVNVINASVYAKERGLTFYTQTMLSGPESQWEELELTIQTSDGRRACVSGRVEVSGELKIVRIGDLLVDAAPQGTLVVIENKDLPGMIGKVGTLFGNREINISDMRVGRKAKGQNAIMVLTIDGTVGNAFLNELTHLEGVTRATLVRL